MALPAGLMFGAYEVLALEGAGGMGEVYRARDTRLHRDVALKVLPARIGDEPRAVARLQREACLLAAQAGVGCWRSTRAAAVRL